MNLTSAFSRSLKFLSLILIFALLAGCAAPAADGPQGQEDSASNIEPETSGSLPKYIGYISDPTGYPVAYAVVGKTEIATEDGVVSGDFKEYDGQWIPVESMGYATGFAKSYGAEFGSPFFETRLTAFQNIYFLDTAEPFQLFASRKDEITISAEISANLFSGQEVIIGLVTIDPLDVEPRYEPNQAGDGLRLRHAFAIQAFEETWNPVQLGSGLTIPLTFELTTPLSEEAAFVVFDPIQGAWVEQDPACVTEDGLNYQCQLPGLNPLWAIYDRLTEVGSIPLKPARVAAFTLGSMINQTNSTFSGFTLQVEQTEDDVFKQALDNLFGWLRTQSEGGNTVDPNDPALTQLMEDLANAALAYAANNSNESGKSKLGKAIDVAKANGQQSVVDQLNKEMGDLADEIARKVLDEANCGDAKKILLTAEQIQHTSKNEALLDQLSEKAVEVVRDCDIWKGSIKVYLPFPENHPAELPLEHKGMGAWLEFHEVEIWTNIKEPFEMHGTSKVRQFLSAVSYINRDPCLQEVVMFGTPGETTIVFEGFFDGYEFTINTLAVDGPGGIIRQSWKFRDEVEGNCALITQNDYSFSPYYSIIFHGVSSENPPIELIEILNSGFAKCAKECIAGHEKITNPDPDLGLYPFLKGLITWNIIHTHKYLPLAEQ
jgi:hypothetical protein